jgi:hypothetical protein
MRFRMTVVIATIALATVATSAAAVGSQGLARPAGGTEWAQRVYEVDRALAANDLGRAVRELQEAHIAALNSRTWDGLVEVGSAALRVGDATNNREAGLRKARRAYMAAMFRARGLGSLEGVVRAAEAFAMLGDRDAAANGLRIAVTLADRAADAQSLARLEALRERLAERGSTAGTERIQ